MTLRVLTLSTLFPDMTRPNFGIFVERQSRELASREGAEVTVIAPLGIPPWPLSRHTHYASLLRLPVEERWRDLTVYRPRFLSIPWIGDALHVASMTRAILPLVRRLHEKAPFDVIDASFFYPDGPVAQHLSRKLGIPYSVKARGADIHIWGRKPATRKAVLAAGKGAAGLLAVSEAMKRSMIALGMDGEKTRVHYTGVDLDRFAPQDRAAAKAHFGVTGPVILSVGALIPRKGQDLLIRAMPSLPTAILLLAGQGPEGAALERLAEELGVGDRVGLLGAVPHDHLPILYNAADVMALPSASEGMANAWIEAMACGTPIAITDVGGARELLIDAGGTPDGAEAATAPKGACPGSKAGILVERTSEAFADALGKMLVQTPDRVAIRKRAMRFTWAANGDALLDYLRGLAG
ncbi:MAG: glycosyltransferase family 4 protein [Sphingomonadales bacterium]|nr:MAG: glycosyltransferase family 4 protein [Sphingomonadales bacterium]TNF01848.1 MAG: glycosyltransferase family 4 protein [Sphingomonadales bacterium]